MAKDKLTEGQRNEVEKLTNELLSKALSHFLDYLKKDHDATITEVKEHRKNKKSKLTTKK